MRTYHPAQYEVSSIDIRRYETPYGRLYALVTVLEMPPWTSSFHEHGPKDPRRQLRTFEVALNSEVPKKTKEKVHRELYSRGIVVDRKTLPTPVSSLQK